MATTGGAGASVPLLLLYSADFGKHCQNCGKPLPERTRKLHCTEECRRAYQNRTRAAARRSFLAGRGRQILFCPDCGKPFFSKSAVDEGQACSPCCRSIRRRRKEFGLPPAEHKPNYDLGLLIAPLGRDPWRAHDLTEDEAAAIWANALLDPMPPEIFSRK